jgi:hypothetical protein
MGFKLIDEKRTRTFKFGQPASGKKQEKQTKGENDKLSV